MAVAIALGRIERPERLMKIRVLFLSLLASGMALFLLLHFGLIWIYGQVRIFEPNIWILAFELTMTFVILGFCTYCCIEQIKILNK
jgi:hypothetical protein